MADLDFLFLSWGDIQGLCEKVSDSIKDSGYEADLLIAVSRGGFDPARIISDELSIKKLASLQIIYYSGMGVRRDEPEILFPLNAQVEGLKVLVVDDVSDSGNSLLLVKKYIESKNVKEIRVATLHHKPWSKYTPNYYAEEVDEWIIYPWEPRESVQDIMRMLREKGVEDEDIPGKMRAIGFSEIQIQRYLEL